MTEQPETQTMNPNFASTEELQTLPGVGPTLAERIRQGGPYQEQEDLLQVAGVGEAMLDRWADRLTFEEEVEPTEAAPPDESTMAEPESSRQKGPSGRIRSVERGGVGTLLWVALSILLSVFLSVGMTLGLLLSINGTLNIGRHASVREMDRELAQLEGDLTDLKSRVDGLSQRLDALQGLSGRMGQVEDQVAELEGEMEEALGSVQRMRTRFDAIEEIIESLDTRADRFDQFLEGLQDLLSEGADGPGQESPSEEATPSS
ncbi:MAG: helix-hairpin-helix domain-containing protein [Anaerolineales bacterium]